MLILLLHSSIHRISPLIMKASNIVFWNAQHILRFKVLVINILITKRTNVELTHIYLIPQYIVHVAI